MLLIKQHTDQIWIKSRSIERVISLKEHKAFLIKDTCLYFLTSSERLYVKKRRVIIDTSAYHFAIKSLMNLNKC